MSFYNVMHGRDPLAATCLNALGLNPKAIPRFRDAYLDGEEIVILTRTGGCNREFYDKDSRHPMNHAANSSGPWNDDLRDIPYYVRDDDDKFDSTFALFRFRFPPECAVDLKRFSQAAGKPESLREKTEMIQKSK